MHCPTLKDLPPPPPAKSGWPWTEEPPQPLDAAPFASAWPRISIVTPSYNQARFIEETIRSVLLQGYPNLEYIIIDNGSSDGSLEIIKKYAPWLKHWMSEKDQGQSDALNKGFSLCSGEILAFLNSDDMFLPEALQTVALSYVKNGRFIWLASAVLWGEGLTNNRIWQPLKASFPIFVSTQTVAQQGVFWAASAKPKPYFDNKKHFCMDHRFFTEIYLRHGPPRIINKATAFFRKHPGAKTWRLTERLKDERQELIDEIIARVNPQTALRIRKETFFEEAIYTIQEFLNDNSKSITEKRKGLVAALKILTRAFLLLPGRTFFSLLVRLRMRGRRVFCLVVRLLRQLTLTGN